MTMLVILGVMFGPFIIWSICKSTIAQRKADYVRSYQCIEYRRFCPGPDDFPYLREDH